MHLCVVCGLMRARVPACLCACVAVCVVDRRLEGKNEWLLLHAALFLSGQAATHIPEFPSFFNTTLIIHTAISRGLAEESLKCHIICCLLLYAVGALGLSRDCQTSGLCYTNSYSVFLTLPL